MLQSASRRLTLSVITLSAIGALPATGQTINEDLKVTAPDAAAGDEFGRSIAIDNGIVAVGSIRDSANGINSGSAYLFDAATGAQLFKLLASDGAQNDNFGNSIAIDNGVVAVGVYHDDENGSSSGSVYLFDASTGTQIVILNPSDGSANDDFGFSVAIDNGIIAVGARGDDDSGPGSGSAYLFNISTQAQLIKLLASDGVSGEHFGSSIAIDNGIVAVGARWDDDNGSRSGSAYLFDASTGAQLFKLLATDGAADDEFGFSIAISNGIVAVGAYQDDDNGSISGSAYLFDASTGEQIAKLLPSDGTENSFFGSSIAIQDGVVAVGASLSSSAYLFDSSTGVQITQLIPSDGGQSDRFGGSIAIDNGTVAVGAYSDSDFGGNSGSAYVFTASAPCPADLTNDGALNFFDISAFLAAFAKNDPVADFTNDGTFNFFDISAFLAAFAQGCP